MYCCCRCFCFFFLIIGVFELIFILVLGIPLVIYLGSKGVEYDHIIISKFGAIVIIIMLLVDCLARLLLITGVLEENTQKLTIWIKFERAILILSIVGGIVGAIFFWDVLQSGKYYFSMFVRVPILLWVINYRDSLLGVKLEIETPQVQIATVP